MAPSNTNRPRKAPLDALAGLKFNEPGLRALRRVLGEGDMYQRYKSRFDAADLAWLAEGAHRDNRHSVVPFRFHPDWVVARQVETGDREEARAARNEFKSAVKSLVFDLITMLDRISGGSSYYNHVDGAIQPGQAFGVESVKMDVYITPSLLDEVPEYDAFVADLTQRFAKTIGVHTITRWRAAFKKEGYSLPPVPDAHPRHYVLMRPYMPTPLRGTSHYICYGRRVGELEAMLAASESADDGDDDIAQESGGARPASPVSVDSDDDTGSCGGPVANNDKPGELSCKDDVTDELAAMREYIRDLEETIKCKDDELRQLRLQLDIARQGLSGPGIASPRPLAVAADLTSTFGPGMAMYRPPATPTPSRASAAARTAPGTPAHLQTSASPCTVPATSTDARENMVPASRPAVTGAALASNSTSSPSVVSMSDWSASMPPSPLPRVGNSSQWEFPAHPFRSPHQRLARYGPIGPATDAALRNHGLPCTVLRELNAIVRDHPDDEWAQRVASNLQLDERVAESITAAMLEDVPFL